jgi:hypothetical protein
VRGLAFEQAVAGLPGQGDGRLGVGPGHLGMALGGPLGQRQGLLVEPRRLGGLAGSAGSWADRAEV